MDEHAGEEDGIRILIPLALAYRYSVKFANWIRQKLRRDE